jgi:large subunit ribosomal protein L32
MRQNRSQSAKRRSHHALAAARVSICECGGQRQSHRACPSCGKYNGRVVVDIVAREKRDQRRSKRREKNLRESGQDTSNKEKEAAVT